MFANVAPKVTPGRNINEMTIIFKLISVLAVMFIGLALSILREKILTGRLKKCLETGNRRYPYLTQRDLNKFNEQK